MENKLQTVFDKYLSLTIGKINPIRKTSLNIIVWVNEDNKQCFITKLKSGPFWVYEDVYIETSNLFGVDEQTTDEMFVHWFNENQNLIKLDPYTYVRLESRY